MPQFDYWLLIVSIFSFLPDSPAQEAAESGPGSLRTFFAGQGYAGAPLQRRLGNHMFVSALINNKPAALLIDTGAPYSIIDRNSVATLGLTVEKTNASVGRVFGMTREHFGVSKLSTLAMGNCMLSNVPVAIADTHDINAYYRVSHIDGLFGAYEMVKFGMVVDCARQMIYVNPRGPSSATSQKLAGFLQSRGFTRIPLRLTPNHHFDVEAAINGHPARLIVDTGAGTTLLAKEFAVQAGVVPTPLRLAASAGDDRFVRLNGGQIKELAIGSFKVTNAEIELANISKKLGAGLLGEEYLTFNFAVIDLGGMNLYLRHPDPR